MFFAIIFVACEKKDKVQEKIDEIPMELKVERFEKDFYSSKPEDLAALKQKYPGFFPPGNEDEVWISKMKDTLQLEFNSEVQKSLVIFQNRLLI